MFYFLNFKLLGKLLFGRGVVRPFLPLSNTHSSVDSLLALLGIAQHATPLTRLVECGGQRRSRPQVKQRHRRLEQCSLAHSLHRSPLHTLSHFQAQSDLCGHIRHCTIVPRATRQFSKFLYSFLFIYSSI